MGIGNFLVMLLSFTGAAVTIIWVISQSILRLKRMDASSGANQLTTEEIDAIRAWLAEQDHTDTRVEQLEERVDFVERMLGRTREAQKLEP
jgi:hypothetical protein